MKSSSISPEAIFIALINILQYIPARTTEVSFHGPSPHTGWCYEFDRSKGKIRYEDCKQLCTGSGGRVPLDAPGENVTKEAEFISNLSLTQIKAGDWLAAYWYGYTAMPNFAEKTDFVDGNGTATGGKWRLGEPSPGRDRCTTLLQWPEPDFAVLNNENCDSYVFCICQQPSCGSTSTARCCSGQVIALAVAAAVVILVCVAALLVTCCREPKSVRPSSRGPSRARMRRKKGRGWERSWTISV